MEWSVLALELTRSCTNRCTYCYGSGRPIVGNMQEDVIRAALDMFKDGDKPFHISLLGGEPSLRLWHFLPILAEYNFGDKVSISVNTNAQIWTEDMCKQLSQFEARLAISLDGPAVAHNLCRKKVNGSDTYDDVVKNIPMLLKYFPKSFCQATFTPDTIRYLSDSYFLAKELGFKEWYWAPDLYNSKWTEKEFDILNKELEVIAQDYFNQDQIVYRSFIVSDEFNSGNARFRNNQKCLLVDPDGRMKISRLNATVVPPQEDELWYIGNVLTGIDEQKIQNWEDRYGKDADELYYAYNIKSVCAKCPAKAICYDSEHMQPNPYLYRIQAVQPRMQCEQKRAIMKQVQAHLT